MIEGIGRDRLEARLQAYHDGELSWLGRWRLERLLARDAGLREELDGLGRLGVLLQEVDAELPTPDLWESVRMRLPAMDARRTQTERAGHLGRGPRWVGAGLAAVAAALALVVGLNLAPSDSAPASVRWLDSRGNPVLVLQDDRDATIIWLLEPNPDNASRRTLSVFS